MEKKPIITRRISAGTRVYYFDAHRDSKGQPYIAISEIPTGLFAGEKKRQRIFVHAEHFDDFARLFSDVVNELEDASEL